MRIRRDKLEALRKRGLDPFGTSFSRTHLAGEVHEHFAALEGTSARLAGRILAFRSHGKASFADLHDRSGRIQLLVRMDRLGEAKYRDFLELDLGDIIGVEGDICRTRRGEISLQVDDWRLLTKCLRPLPS